MFGEWFMGGPGDPYYSDAVKFANRSGMSLLDYPLAIALRDVFASDRSFTEVQNTIEKEDQVFDRPNDLVTFVDNHDIPRVLTIDPSRDRFDEATAFVLTCRGIPTIYYGDEQYLHNDTDQGRDPYTRVWMSSYDTGTRGFRLVKALAALRAKNDALAYGSMTVRYAAQDALVFERNFGKDTVLVAINKHDSRSVSIPQLETSLPAESYQDYLRGLMGGMAIRVSGREGYRPRQVGPLTLAPHSVAVWQITGAPAGPAIGSIGPTVGQPGMTITIAGAGFGAKAGSVRWRGTAATIRSWTDATVTVSVPDVPNGSYPVQLTTAHGTISNPMQFPVLQGRLIPITFTVNGVPPDRAALYLTGDTVEIGQWSTATERAPGPFLCPRAPTCFLDISVPAGKQIRFKLFRIAPDGTVTKENGNSHVFHVPEEGTGAVTVDWQK